MSLNIASPSLSVVTVVLNDHVGLSRTGLSILSQTYPREWIVVDGGSYEATINVLSDFGDDVRWVSKKDKGIYDAMNRGVSMTTGDFVVFMNAGDTFHDSNTLAKVAGALSTHNQRADILFGGAMLSFLNSDRLVYRPPRLVENSLWHGLPANHQATYYRRSLLDQTPYDLKYSLCGDYYLAASLMEKGARAIYLDSPLAIFEVGGQSYRRLGQLFAEPYRIQRDILGCPLHYRLVSMLKRLISTLGFVVLSQSFFKRK